MSEERQRQAKQLLNNKLFWKLLDDLEIASIKDWKGNNAPDKQGAIWHRVTTITAVRDSVRRECERITKHGQSDSTN